MVDVRYVAPGDEDSGPALTAGAIGTTHVSILGIRPSRGPLVVPKGEFAFFINRVKRGDYDELVK